MLVKDAEEYFGSRLAIIKALGSRTRSAIYQWDEVVPLMAARELESLTNGALKVDYGLYGKSGHIASNISA